LVSEIRRHDLPAVTEEVGAGWSSNKACLCPTEENGRYAETMPGEPEPAEAVLSEHQLSSLNPDGSSYAALPQYRYVRRCAQKRTI
jgi:hypothetical protein